MDSAWGWTAMIDRLTGGDITKDEQVFKINYIHCMNRLSFWSAKDEYIDKMNRLNEQKNKR